MATAKSHCKLPNYIVQTIKNNAKSNLDTKISCQFKEKKISHIKGEMNITIKAKLKKRIALRISLH